MVIHDNRRSGRIISITLWILVFVMATAWEPAARASASLCGAILTDDLTLDQDLTCPSDALVVGADGVRINLDGHAIRGAGIGVGIAIKGHAGVTIAGAGTIAAFNTAVLIQGGRDVVVKDIVLANNVDGVDVQQGSSGITIKASEFTANSTRGVMLRSGVDDVEVKNNTFTGNRVGVLVNGPTNATVKANVISSSLLAGMRVGPVATDNLLLDNIITGNPAGIEFLVMAGASAIGNTVQDNLVTANTCGVKGPTDGNAFQGNAISANATDFCA